MEQRRFSAVLTSCVVVAGTLLATPPAAALDAKKAAAEQMAASKVAAQAGDHRNAYDHALQAWQLDPTGPSALWTAAREAQLANLLDVAETSYREWLRLPMRDVAMDLQAHDRLKEIRILRAAAKAKDADTAAKVGDHVTAHRLLLEAISKNTAPSGRSTVVPGES